MATGVLKVYDGTDWIEVAGLAGDVVGPSSANDLRIVLFDGTTGKLIKQSIGSISALGVLTGITANANIINAGTFANTQISKSSVTQHVPNVIAARKTADVTIDTDNTFTDDADLVVTIEASKNYLFFLLLKVVSDATPDFKWQITGPSSGASLLLTGGGGRTGANVSTNFRDVTAFSQATALIVLNTTLNYITMQGVLKIGGTPSTTTIALQWAQNTSSGTSTTLKEGSFLRLEEIA